MAHKIYKLKDGTVVPSVTTIISNNLGWNKNMLIAWSKKIALTQGRDSNEITEEAADVGHLTHTLIEHRIKTKMGIEQALPDITGLDKELLKKAKFGYLAFLDWEAKWKPDRYVFSELEMVSESHKYGGTMDIMAEKDGHLYIIDIKTSNSIHPEMVIQLQAYRELFHENYSNKHVEGNPFDKRYVDGSIILKLSKDEQKYEEFPVTPDLVQPGWEAFVCLLRLDNDKKLLAKFGK